MPDRKDDQRPVSGRLRFRVAALLALALLPIGILGVVQTRSLAIEAQTSSELSLLALTERATFGERQVLERAVGTAEALAPFLELIRDDPEACRSYLDDYVGLSPRYSFVGFVPVSGLVTCSSADRTVDFSGEPLLQTRMNAPRLYIDLIESPAVSVSSVINVMFPTYEGSDFAGFMSISFSTETLAARGDRVADMRPDSVVTFNAEGVILSTESSAEGDPISLPRSVTLEDLATRRPDETFIDLSQSGEERIFAVVPVVPGVVYALAGWPREAFRLGGGMLPLPTAAFPLMMWVASLFVAYIAVDRLVGRYVRGLSDQMRTFARDRRIPKTAVSPGAAQELQDLETSFVQMAFALLDDEAQMEDALREKNVLLKEVHHRVKNNLQMISSIMNMNMRTAEHPETRAVLRQLQDRILGLSTVHRNLYMAENLSRTNAGELMKELLNKVFAVGAAPGSNLHIEMDFDDVILFPDQAVPLSMLATELGTNALKHAGAAEGESPWIRVSLKQPEPGKAVFVFRNSIGPEAVTKDAESSGLGLRLVRAVASQLSAVVETTDTNNEYKVVMSFDLEDFDPEPREG